MCLLSVIGEWKVGQLATIVIFFPLTWKGKV